MQPVFGIDFGTTNSALSIYLNGKVKVITVDEGALLRSVLYFNDEQDIFVGQEAIGRYVWPALPSSPR